MVAETRRDLLISLSCTGEGNWVISSRTFHLDFGIATQGLTSRASITTVIDAYVLLMLTIVRYGLIIQFKISMNIARQALLSTLYR